VTRCIEGTGKLAGSMGAMVVQGLTGVESEIGSSQLTNEQRQWIWQHRDMLAGQVVEVRALTVNESLLWVFWEILSNILLPEQVFLRCLMRSMQIYLAVHLQPPSLRRPEYQTFCSLF
ncbi:MAG: hypothetical protein ACLQVG_05935, partial [Terriglobia bacterium]